MIDMVELLRMSRRATDIPCSPRCGSGLLRLPAYTEILLAFAVLVGGIGALLSLNRKSELTVMRAGGMSVWQFLRPGLAVALMLGVFAVTVYNPLAAAARSEAERLVAEASARKPTCWRPPERNSWLRQDGADGQSVMSARAAADRGLTLTGVIVYQFDPRAGSWSASSGQRASLGDGYWEIRSVGLPPRPRTRDIRYLYGQHIPYTGARQRRLGSVISVSFWQLPGH